MGRQTQDRDWFLHLDGDPMYVASDDEQLGRALAECHTILSRIGGGIVIGANRAELAPGVWETVGFSFRWVSFMPGVRFVEDDEQVEDREPEAVEAV